MGLNPVLLVIFVFNNHRVSYFKGLFVGKGIIQVINIIIYKKIGCLISYNCKASCKGRM
jgi:hypothetical protein